MGNGLLPGVGGWRGEGAVKEEKESEESRGKSPEGRVNSTGYRVMSSEFRVPSFEF
jgi:hypothetical protein